jgi:hypothetical protein
MARGFKIGAAQGPCVGHDRRRHASVPPPPADGEPSDQELT